MDDETQTEKGERNEMLRHAWPSELPVTQARSVLRGVTTSKGYGEGIYREMALAPVVHLFRTNARGMEAGTNFRFFAAVYELGLARFHSAVD